MRGPAFNRLRLRVTVGTALILGLFLTLLGTYLINSQERQMVSNLRDHGERIAALTARSSAEYIQRFSFFLMEDQALAVEQSPQIAFCEIYDARDKPLLQSGNIVSKDHSGKHTARYDESVMVVTQPIMAADVRLGRVEIGLRLNSIAETIHDKRQAMTVLFTGFTLMVIVLVNVFFSRLFISPVKRLAEGTQRVADREFVTVDLGPRDDEIGLLARNFNDMSRRLKDLYQNLEDKVGQRTRAMERANQDLLKAIDHAREMARRAEAGTMAKSQFLASMSHEMRTPMNAVLGMGEILSSTELDEEQRRYLSILRESGNALLHLIDDILDLSRIEAGEMVFEHRPFHLEKTVARPFRVVSCAAHKKGLDVDYALAPDVPDEVEGDPLRLQQILLNLLGNGVKFTETGYVLLDVSLGGPAPGNGRFLNFRVRDTGIGIKPDKLESIFEKFTQADSSTTRKHGGSGLGLSICQMLCEGLGGSIRIESDLDKGCTVFFSLPFGVRPAVPDRASPLSGKTLLLYDDRDHADRTLAARLKRAGARVDLCATLDRALENIRAVESHRPYDAILVNSTVGENAWRRATSVLAEAGVDAGSVFPILPSDGARPRSMHFFGATLNRPASTPDVEAALAGTADHLPKAKEADSEAPARSCPLDILLVEDSPANAMLIGLYLKDSGHTLTLAENGKNALDLCRKNRFDLVLMDIEMPVMDGVECTRRLRQWERENGRQPARVVALTAHALNEVRDRVLSCGCDSFLTKPITRQELLKAVNSPDTEGLPN